MFKLVVCSAALLVWAAMPLNGQMDPEMMGFDDWNDTNQTMNATMNSTMEMETPVAVCRTGSFNPPSCNMTCEAMCGPGHHCDPVNGTCMCNPCYSGDYCQNVTESSACLDVFLRAPDKDAITCEQFGCTPPMIDDFRLRKYLIEEVINLNDKTAYISGDYTIVDRSSTGARPLGKVNYRLNYNVDRPGVRAYLDSLKDKVKRGEIRCTLAVQDVPTTSLSPTTADVTMNI